MEILALFTPDTADLKMFIRRAEKIGTTSFKPALFRRYSRGRARVSGKSLASEACIFKEADPRQGLTAVSRIRRIIFPGMNLSRFFGGVKAPLIPIQSCLITSLLLVRKNSPLIDLINSAHSRKILR